MKPVEEIDKPMILCKYLTVEIADEVVCREPLTV